MAAGGWRGGAAPAPRVRVRGGDGGGAAARRRATPLPGGALLVGSEGRFADTGDVFCAPELGLGEGLGCGARSGPSKCGCGGDETGRGRREKNSVSISEYRPGCLLEARRTARRSRDHEAGAPTSVPGRPSKGPGSAAALYSPSPLLRCAPRPPPRPRAHSFRRAPAPPRRGGGPPLQQRNARGPASAAPAGDAIGGAALPVSLPPSPYPMQKMGVSACMGGLSAAAAGARGGLRAALRGARERRRQWQRRRRAGPGRPGTGARQRGDASGCGVRRETRARAGGGGARRRATGRRAPRAPACARASLRCAW
jgi:hypothetical protein